jgi:hypothetical protein
MAIRTTKLLRAGLLSALVAATAMPVAVPAARAGSTAVVEPALQPCVDLALEEKNRQWICTAEGLLAVTDQQGKPVGKLTPVKPANTGQDRGAGPAWDDYDSWCESGTICRRIVNGNRYIGETKGNAAYGNQDGVIGSYDAVIRTRFHHRWPEWTVALIHDSGPNLRFSGTLMNCRQDLLAVDRNCGFRHIGGPNLNVGNRRYDSTPKFGPKLAERGMYYGVLTTNFTPAGYPAYVASPLRTAQYYCWDSLQSFCYFSN